MHLLNPHSLSFPPVHLASPEGLLAVGGDLRVERLLEAYRRGIFPWYNAGQPILWWSPDPRALLYPERLHVARSLRKTLRRAPFRVCADTAFDRVVRECAAPRRGARAGTWITPEIRAAYGRLHTLGYAHSIESWRGDALVGGLYGIALGDAFFGESMFSRETDASKVAFVHLVRQVQRWGFNFIDCQIQSDYLKSLGAEDAPRSDFIRALDAALARPDRVGPWRLDSDLIL